MPIFFPISHFSQTLLCSAQSKFSLLVSTFSMVVLLSLSPFRLIDASDLFIRSTKKHVQRVLSSHLFCIFSIYSLRPLPSPPSLLFHRWSFKCPSKSRTFSLSCFFFISFFASIKCKSKSDRTRIVKIDRIHTHTHRQLPLIADGRYLST